MIGIDEVGRGSWAGPLLLCALELDEGVDLGAITDSKLMTKSAREKAALEIKQKAVQIELAWVSAAAIDKYGMAEVMRIACRQLISEFSNQECEIVIDGAVDYVGLERSRNEAKAEIKYPAVAAASVVAKVTRDSFMAACDNVFDGYDFKAHKGYGTAAHRQAMIEQGVTQLHRKSFKPVYQIEQQFRKTSRK